jgi:hypothetical protein
VRDVDRRESEIKQEIEHRRDRVRTGERIRERDARRENVEK